MWSDWLAETLNRSTFDPAPRRLRVQRVLVSDDGASERGLENADWEVVTGLMIHEGFGAGSPDA